MTADADPGGRSSPAVLLPGASPAVVRAHLGTEDGRAFDQEYAAALAHAREQLDLAPLMAMVEHWRRIAVLQRDPAAFRHTVRRAAQVLTGEDVPDEEPSAVTRSRIGL